MHPAQYTELTASQQPISSSQARDFRLLNLNEAAKRLRISTRHLQRLMEIGQGPAVTRLGERRIAFTENALAAWVQERTVNRAA